MLLGSTAWAQTGEIGHPSDGPVPSVDIPPLSFELSASFGYELFMEEDMQDTYQGLPSYGLEFAVGLGDKTSFFMAGRYGSTKGDPFYYTPDFQSGVENELTTVPLMLGVRVNASEHPRLRVLMGAAFQALWYRESVPSASTGDITELEDYDGWGTGFLFTIQPQWRSLKDDLGVGLELGLGGGDGSVRSHGSRHDVNTVGVSARLVVSKSL